MAATVEDSPVVPFFAGRTVLLTGATGFVGRAVLARLLDVPADQAPREVLLIVRRKRGVESSDRVNELLQADVFKRACTRYASEEEMLTHVRGIEGDVTQVDLGVKDRSDIADVSVVIHCAAAVSFDLPFTDAVTQNAVSVRRVLRLCRELPCLDSVVFVSTAYAGCDRPHIAEQVFQYEPAWPDWLIDGAIDAAESREPVGFLDGVYSTMCRDFPNTYTASKRLAEILVQRECHTLKGVGVSLVRPSIIGAAESYPHPGWVHGLAAASAVYTAVGAGVGRVMPGDTTKRADLVPVDYVTGTILAAAAWVTDHRDEGAIVTNCTTTGCNISITWGEIVELVSNSWKKNPAPQELRHLGTVWDPKCSMVKPGSGLRPWRFIRHTVFAYALDSAAALTGDTRFQLSKAIKKTDAALMALMPFTVNEWTWDSESITTLRAFAGTAYVDDLREMDWQEYIDNYCIGLCEGPANKVLVGDAPYHARSRL